MERPLTLSPLEHAIVNTLVAHGPSAVHTASIAQHLQAPPHLVDRVLHQRLRPLHLVVPTAPDLWAIPPHAGAWSQAAHGGPGHATPVLIPPGCVPGTCPNCMGVTFVYSAGPFYPPAPWSTAPLTPALRKHSPPPGHEHHPHHGAHVFGQDN